MLIAPLSDTEIEKRKPVWAALSDLWLDTEIQEGMLDYIAKVMEESGYSIKELYHIYYYEVAPVVYMNLHSPAGAWDGFREEWLFEEIQKSIGKLTAFRKFMLRLKKRPMTYATEELWEQLAEKVYVRRVK